MVNFLRKLVILNIFNFVSPNHLQETNGEEHITMNSEKKDTPRQQEPLANGDLSEPPVKKPGIRIV